MWLIGTNTREPHPRRFRTRKAAKEFARQLYEGQIYFVWKLQPAKKAWGLST